MGSKKLDKSEILGSIEANLRKEFDRVHQMHYNPNTKGHDYEEILKAFYEKYLGNLFNFHTRVPIYDSELKCQSIFRNGENEFDVVTTYKNTLPRIILEAGKTPFIPYDSTAFITEVKQTLTKSNFDKDLGKLGKLSKLKLGENVRLPKLGVVHTQFRLGRPLRILFYYEKEMKDALIWQHLRRSEDTCDFLVIFRKNWTVLNSHLPIAKQISSDLKKPEGRPALEQIYPLTKLMYYLTLSIEYPIMVNAWGIFETLFSQ